MIRDVLDGAHLRLPLILVMLHALPPHAEASLLLSCSAGGQACGGDAGPPGTAAGMHGLKASSAVPARLPVTSPHIPSCASPQCPTLCCSWGGRVWARRPSFARWPACCRVRKALPAAGSLARHQLGQAASPADAAWLAAAACACPMCHVVSATSPHVPCLAVLQMSCTSGWSLWTPPMRLAVRCALGTYRWASAWGQTKAWYPKGSV